MTRLHRRARRAGPAARGAAAPPRAPPPPPRGEAGGGVEARVMAQLLTEMDGLTVRPP